MRKLIFILFTLLFACGCQIQINLASSVVNVPVSKTQISDGDAEMSGSALDDFGKGNKQESKLDATVTP